MRELAGQFLALAEKQGATIPLMVGHRLMGTTLHYSGNFLEARAHYDRAIALYDPVEHRALSTRFGQDVRVVILCQRATTLWCLGYPAAALADAEQALKYAREIGQASTLMYGMNSAIGHALWGNYTAAKGLGGELIALADQIGSVFWKSLGTTVVGCAMALRGEAPDAVQAITSGLSGLRSSGATVWVSWALPHLAIAYSELGQFDDAWHCIGEALTAMETTKEKWHEAEVNRTAGEIALKSPQPDTAKAEAYFERALTIARKQQAKSLELRAATSMARLWRDQGKRDEARELLAPVYGWFTEGFDTRDLKKAKVLLNELA
jgi:predicted ATPase